MRPQRSADIQIITVQAGSYQANIVLDINYKNTLDKSELRVTYYPVSLSRHFAAVTDAAGRTTAYVFDSLRGQNGWRLRRDPHGEFLSSKKLAEAIAKDLLNRMSPDRRHKS